MITFDVPLYINLGVEPWTPWAFVWGGSWEGCGCVKAPLTPSDSCTHGLSPGVCIQAVSISRCALVFTTLMFNRSPFLICFDRWTPTLTGSRNLSICRWMSAQHVSLLTNVCGVRQNRDYIWFGGGTRRKTGNKQGKRIRKLSRFHSYVCFFGCFFLFVISDFSLLQKTSQVKTYNFVEELEPNFSWATVLKPVVPEPHGSLVLLHLICEWSYLMFWHQMD